jgi:glycosyltransferase involved in cell wall biosynthesis
MAEHLHSVTAAEEPTLVIDASNLLQGGGVTHLIEVLTAADAPRYGFASVTVWGKKRVLEQLPARPWLVTATHTLLEGSIVKRLFWQRYVLGRKLRRAENYALWVPGGSYIGPPRNFVTMMRNLLPFDRPERRRVGWSKNRLRLKVLAALQARTFRRAAGVIFLSEYSRRKAEAATGKLKGATAVIPHGIGNQFFQAPRPQRARRAVSSADPFRLLYVSAIDVYKHQWHVAEAVARLRQAGWPVRLDLVGPMQRLARDQMEGAMRRLDPGGEFIFTPGAMPYDQMSGIYRSADVFLYASSCETFGNILLEAMAAGLPIACSNRSAMPEVLGTAGLYFDPENPTEIEVTLLQLLESPALREDFAEKAYRRAAEFSWEKCAAATLTFLHECGADRRNGEED